MTLSRWLRSASVILSGVIVVSLAPSRASAAENSPAATAYSSLRSFVISAPGHDVVAQLLDITGDPGYVDLVGTGEKSPHVGSSDLSAEAANQLAASLSGVLAGQVPPRALTAMTKERMLQLDPAYASFAELAAASLRSDPRFWDAVLPVSAGQLNGSCDVLCLVTNGLSYVSTALSIAGAVFTCTVGEAATEGVDTPLCLLAIGSAATSTLSYGLGLYATVTYMTNMGTGHTGVTVGTGCTNAGFCEIKAIADTGQSIETAAVGECFMYSGYSASPSSLSTGFVVCPTGDAVATSGNNVYYIYVANNADDGYSSSMRCYSQFQGSVSVKNANGSYTNNTSTYTRKVIDASCPQQHLR